MERACNPFDQVYAQHLLTKSTIACITRAFRQFGGRMIEKRQPRHRQRRHGLPPVDSKQRQSNAPSFGLEQAEVKDIERANHDPRLPEPTPLLRRQRIQAGFDRSPGTNSSGAGQRSSNSPDCGRDQWIVRKYLQGF